MTQPASDPNQAPGSVLQALTLRVSMQHAPDQPTTQRDVASAASPGGLTATLSKALDALDPKARPALLELVDGDTVYGAWPFTAKDLNISFDPEVLEQLTRSVPGLRPAFDQLVARGAQSLLDRYPTVVTANRLDNLRKKFASEPSLPLVISRQLADMLEILQPARRFVWLELAEPIGFLSLLPWERLLRRAVRVPLVRRARRVYHGLRRSGKLTVMLACASNTAQPLVDPKAVVTLCRQTLDAVKPTGHIVIHLFADVTQREGITAALDGAGLPFVTDGEVDGTGLIVHPLPSQTAVEDSQRSAEAPPADQPLSIWERPWGAWVRQRLAGRAVDVVHLVGHASFSGRQPVMELLADPGAKPTITRQWLIRNISRSSLRYLDAQICSTLAAELGAWAIVFGAPSAESMTPMRALLHQVSGVASGVFAVHDMALGEDDACHDLYCFLARTGPAANESAWTPDHASLLLQCHPASLQGQSLSQLLDPRLGPELEQAVLRLQQALQALSAASQMPTWAAAMLRQIEQAASSRLSDVPRELQASDLASLNGVSAALGMAVRSLADRLEQTQK